MAVKSTNTMAEALQSLVQDIATMKTMSDADLPFLLDLETTIIGYLRQGMDQSMGPNGGPVGQPGGMPGGPMPGSMPTMGGGPPMPPLPASPMGGRAMMAGTASPGGGGGPMTSPDEIQRMLSR